MRAKSFELEDMDEEAYQDLICRMYSAFLYLERHYVGYSGMAEAFAHFNGYGRDKDYLPAIREMYKKQTEAADEDLELLEVGRDG